jgi:hypothetical protein
MALCFPRQLANFIGEFIVFSIAGGVLLWESLRSSAAERKKVSERDAYIDSIKTEVDRLKDSVKFLTEKMHAVSHGASSAS